jgi:hypothetical protein
MSSRGESMEGSFCIDIVQGNGSGFGVFEYPLCFSDLVGFNVFAYVSRILSILRGGFHTVTYIYGISWLLS